MRKTIQTACVKSIALCLLVGAAVLPASAQITTGNITGTVKDAQGGVVPGATVTLIDEARGTKLAPAIDRRDRHVHVSRTSRPPPTRWK